MYGRWTVGVECGQVRGGAVTLVPGESILRKIRVAGDHDTVTGYLRNDGCGGDGETSRISPYHGGLGTLPVYGVDPVDEQMTGGRRKGFDGFLHGQEIRAAYVHGVDNGRIGTAYT